MRAVEVPEVVVEQRGPADLALLGQVQLGLVLDEVLAPLDRPHLPAVGLGHDPLGERDEVAATGRGAGLEHEDVLGPLRPDLDDADAVVLGGRARSRKAGHPLDAQGSGRTRRHRQRHARHDRNSEQSDPRHRHSSFRADPVRHHTSGTLGGCEHSSLPPVSQASRSPTSRTPGRRPIRPSSRSERSASTGARSSGSSGASRGPCGDGISRASSPSRRPTAAVPRPGRASSG